METEKFKWMLQAGKPGKMGLRRLDGTLLMPEVFDYCLSGYGFATCLSSGQLFVVNPEAEFVRQERGMTTYSPVSDGMLIVDDTTTEMCGYLSIDSAEMDIPCQFTNGTVFSNGVASVKVLTSSEVARWGLINKEGRFLVPPMYLSFGQIDPCSGVAPFCDYISRVSHETRWGLINKAGEITVSPRWRGMMEGFSEGVMVAAETNNRNHLKWGVVNTFGEWVLLPKWDDLSGAVSEGSIGASLNGKWGLINMEGEWIIPPKFEYCGALHQQMARASIRNKDGNLKTGFMTASQEWIIEPKYDECDDFEYGLARISICNVVNGTCQNGYADRDGREFWEAD